MNLPQVWAYKELFLSESQTSHEGLERLLDPLRGQEANRASPKLSSTCMAGVTAVQASTIETKTTDVKEGDDANQAQIHNARASSSRSGGPPSNCRVWSRRPDGTSEEPGPSELRLLEQALRRESVVDVVEIGPLTVPSTPVRDDSRDGIGNDVRSNLELASVKLSKLAPTD